MAAVICEGDVDERFLAHVASLDAKICAFQNDPRPARDLRESTFAREEEKKIVFAHTTNTPKNTRVPLKKTRCVSHSGHERGRRAALDGRGLRVRGGAAAPDFF